MTRFKARLPIRPRRLCGTLCAAALLAAAISSCRTGHDGAAPALAPELERTELLCQQGNYTAAMLECIDVSRAHPDLPGLAEMQSRIVKELAAQRDRDHRLRAANTDALLMHDVNRHSEVPDTYNTRRTVRGQTGSLRGVPSSMEKALRKKVTVHLDRVGLSDFILAIGASEGINIVADDFQIDKTMTLHAEETPLGEIMDYVSRNLGVVFSVGENMIWVTQDVSATPGLPMETRMYRLRKGMSGTELTAGDDQINVLNAIQRFVPVVDGGDAMFDSKAHVLIVRNTRENLTKIEDLIETLDVCPPQVLIEARFISTKASDLSELGIDWVLNSPLVISTKSAYQFGKSVALPATAIEKDSSITFPEFPNSAQGLNLTYSGILTDPMFQAVLHALEVSGRSRTLSVPKVTTVNNRPAMIRIGEDFRYFEEYEVQTVPLGTPLAGGSTIYGSEVVPVGRPALEELGIQLDVTPSVGADLQTVTLKLLPEISEFVRYETYEVGSANNGNFGGVTNVAGTNANANSLLRLPIFRRSRIETEVLVRSGETVVMGGLIASTESRHEDKVPFLSHIPIIGRLFRHDTVEEDKRNLLIFVTATILSERGEQLVPLLPGSPGS